MDELQNQDLVDDKMMQDISGAAPAPAPAPAPIMDDDQSSSDESEQDTQDAPPEPTVPTPVSEPASQAKVPSVHDLGILTDDVPADESPANEGYGDEKSSEKNQASDSPSSVSNKTSSTETLSAIESSIKGSSGSGAPLTPQDENLVSVKKQALEQLSPLIDKLDLPPEKKFETYMEVIRASDDKNLIEPAFQAANAIEDEDKKAQALLDVVNEVNYLTQDHNQNT